MKSEVGQNNQSPRRKEGEGEVFIRSTSGKEWFDFDRLWDAVSLLNLRQQHPFFHSLLDMRTAFWILVLLLIFAPSSPSPRLPSTPWPKLRVRGPNNYQDTSIKSFVTEVSPGSHMMFVSDIVLCLADMLVERGVQKGVPANIPMQMSSLGLL